MRSRFIPAASTIMAATIALLVAPLTSVGAVESSSTLTITGLSGGQSTATTSFVVSSFTFTIEATSSTSAGGAGTGKATFEPLEVHHELKSAEALLLKSASEGRHLPQVVLLIKVGDAEIATFTLTDATVAEATMSGKAGASTTTFAYQEVSVTVKGSSFCWDLAGNIAC